MVRERSRVSVATECVVTRTEISRATRELAPV